MAYTEMQTGYDFEFHVVPYANIITWLEMNVQSSSPFREVYLCNTSMVTERRY